MSRYFSASWVCVCVCVCVVCVCHGVCISLQSLHPLPLSVSPPPPSFPLFLILPHFSHGEKRGVFFLLDYRVFSACHKQKNRGKIYKKNAWYQAQKSSTKKAIKQQKRLSSRKNAIEVGRRFLSERGHPGLLGSMECHTWWHHLT